VYLLIGERTNVNGFKVFCDVMFVEYWDECVEIVRL